MARRTAMETFRAKRPWQEHIFSEVDKIIQRDTRRAERSLKKFLAELSMDQAVISRSAKTSEQITTVSTNS